MDYYELAGAITGVMAAEYVRYKHGGAIKNFFFEAALEASSQAFREMYQKDFEAANPHVVFNRRMNPLGLK